MFLTLLLAVGTIVSGWLVMAPVFAQSTNRIGVSLSLYDTSYKPIQNGSYEVRFAIYATDRTESDAYPSNSDARVWEETQTVEVKNGVLQAFLGSTTSFPSALFSGTADYYLGVRIGKDSEMTPRKQMSAVPFALNAQYLQGATVGEGEGNIPLLSKGGKFLKKYFSFGNGDGDFLAGNDSRLDDIHSQNTDTGTSETDFNIGSGTSLSGNDFTLSVSSASSRPALRFNGTSNEWEFSNDGSTYQTIGDIGNYVATITAGNGISGSSTTEGGTPTLSVNVLDAIDGIGGTSSYSGLEFQGASNQLTLLQGCANGQGLSFNTATKVWECTSFSAGLAGTGTAGYATYWSGVNSLGSEQYLNALRGGTGVNGSAAANGSLLIGNGSGYALATLTGSNGLAVSNGVGSITLSLDVATTGTTGTTASNSGLETSATGLRLLGGCINDQVLAWNVALEQWVCSNKTGGTSDWSSGGAFTYLTNVTDSLVLGGSSTDSGFFFDVSTSTISFEGTTANNFETFLSVIDPTADRNISFPNASGTLALTSDLHNAVTVSGQNYLSLAGQVITANPIDLSGTNVTGTLAAARFGALSGDVTNTAGSYATTIANNAVTYAKIQNITSQTLVGRYAATGGVAQEITIGSGLTLNTGTGVLSASGTGGTVTTLSVVTANGVSGSVSNPTTTPAITLTLGAITPTTVNGLTLTSAADGFTIAGGTTSRTLTVTGGNASISGAHTGTSSGSNTGDQTITLTGDITGSGTGSFATTLATVNSNIGTFNNVTVNAKGLVTAASNVSYLTAESDTLATVTGRGATTATATFFTGGASIRGLTIDTATATDDRLLTSVTTGGAARFDGTVTNADLTAARTYTLPNATGTFITTGNITDISGLTDSQISDTLTASIFIGSGSTTNAVDLATAEVAGILPDGNIASALTGKTYNALTLTSAADGFTIAGGTTSRTLTVTGGNASISGTHSGTSSGTNTGDQTITLTGDITGSGTGSFATTLATVNSNIGTFNNVTVNAKGLVTAASNVSYLTAESDTLATVTGRGATTTTAVTLTGGATLGSSGTDGSLTIFSEQGVTDYTTIFQPGTQTQNITYTLPADDGAATYVLITDGAGNLSWGSVSGGAGGMASFSAAGDTGSQTITDGNTLTIAGGTNITSVASATDTVTLNLDAAITLGSDGTDGSLTIFSEQGATDYTTLFQPGTQTQNITYTLPANDGSATDQALVTDGSGNLSWVTLSGVGGVGDITAIGDVTSSDAFTASGTAGTELYFYDADGRGKLTIANLTAARTYTLPNATGTFITTGNITDISGLTDSQISDTLTASIFIGSGSTTNAVDLATAEVSGILPDGYIASALTGKTYNALTLTSAADGFTIAGGTTSRTLTVTGANASISGTHTGTSSGSNTGDQTITLTGDITGSGTGSFATTLATVNSNVGTYNNVTVNAKGLVTAASNVSYLTAESDTLATVTGRGATTTTASFFTGGASIRGLTIDTATATDDRILTSVTTGGAARFDGTLTAADLTAARTYTLPNATGTFITTGNLTDISGLTDSQISDTLTASIFIGSGSTTNAVDLATAEVSGILPDGYIASALTGKTYNALTLTSAADGFTIAGGTTSRTLTVTGVNASISGTHTGTSSGSNTGDQTITLTGDITGSGTGSFATTLATVNSNVGTYNNVTVNAKGLVTAASNVSYLTAEADTLATVTGRGATTTTASFFTGGASIRGLTIDTATATDDRILTSVTTGGAARFDGTLTAADLTAARTYTLPNATGTFITTGNLTDISAVGANSVALGTDTTGNYVSSATANGGLTLTGTEGASLGILLPAATDALSATTASGSGLELLASGLTLLQGCSNLDVLAWDETADTWECTSVAGTGGVTGTGTNGYNTYWTGTSTLGSEQYAAVSRGGTGVGTFTTNGIIFGNGTGAMSVTAAGTDAQFLVAGATGIPAFVSMSSDATISNTGALTIAADAVALGTDTTGNYVATITNGSGISGSSSTEGGTPTLALGALTADWNQTGAFNISLNDVGAGLKILENGATPTLFGIFDVTDLTTADKTYTFPNESGTVCTTGSICSGYQGTITNPVTGTGTNGYNTYWTGTSTLGSEQYVAMTRGGTGTTLTASNGGIVYSNASTLAVLAGTATAGQALVSGSSAAPSWYVPTAGSVLFAGTGGILQQDNANFFWDDTNNRLGIGDTTPDGKLDFDLASTSTTATSEYGGNFIVSDTGIVTTGTDGTYGNAITVSRSGATGGMINTWGEYISVTTDSAGAGTSTTIGSELNVFGGDTVTGLKSTVYGGSASTTAYGVDVASVGFIGGSGMTIYGVRVSTGDSFTGGGTLYGVHSTVASTTGGTATGLYVDAGTGAGTEYAGIFVNGNVGIGDTTPLSLLTVGSGDLFQVNSSGAIAAAAGITSSGTITFSGLSTAGIVTNTSGGVLGTTAILTSVNGGTGNGFTKFTGPTTAEKTFTLPDASATILTTNALVTVGQGGTGANTFTTNGVLYGNTTGAIQVTAAGTSAQFLVANGSGVPTFVSMSSDATIANTGALTIAADAVALGTDTTGNYVATITNGSGISGSSSTEGGTPTLALGALTADWNQTGAFNISLNDVGAGLKILENGATPTYFGIFDVADLTTADKTYTFPNESGTVCTTGSICTGYQASITNPVTGTGTNGYNTYWTGTSTLGSEQYVAMTRGGTGTTLTANNGGIVYSNATNLAILAGTATAGQALISGASTTPSWYVPTAGSVLFAGVGGKLEQDNASLFFDNTNNRLGIGDTTPDAMFDVDLVSTSTTAAIDYASYINVSDTGIVSSGSDATVGDYISISRSGATGSASTGVTGQYISLSNDGGGTANVVGSQVLASGGDTIAGIVTTIIGGSSTATGNSMNVISTTTTGAVSGYNASVIGGVGTNYGINISVSGSGSSSIYGINSTVTSGATQTAYALYADAGAGAGTEYAGIFMNGNVGIGDTTPASLLTVGNGDLFQVNSSGAIAAATGLTTTGNINISGAQILGASPMIFEGLTDDNITTTLAFADPTSSNKTITFPNETGTVCTTGSICSGYQASITNPVTGTGTNGYNTYWTGTGTLGSEQYVAMTRGGTGTTLTASNGGIVYSDADSFELLAPTATAGLALVSGSSAAPSWFAPTAGSILFAGTGGILEQDNASLFFDNTNNRLGIGITNPASLVQIGGNGGSNGSFSVQANNGSSWFGVNSGNVTFNAAGGTTTAGGTDLGARFNIATIADTKPALAIRGFTPDTMDLVKVSSSAVTTGDLFIITGAGKVGIGDTTPLSLLTVGNGDLFQINASGAIAAAAGITSSGTITFSGLSTAGIVTNTAGGVLGTVTSVPIANGGTNATTIGSAGSIPYSTGTAYAFSAVGTTGQALISGGVGAPTFFAPTAGSILFAGTGGILEQDNANFFFDNTNNRLGLGTAAPSTLLELYGSGADVISTITAADATYDPILKFRTGSTPAIQFSLGVDNSDSGTFKIFSGDGLGSGDEFTIDANGVTTIANLNLGAMNFDTDAGAVTWVDMPVTSAATLGTVERYTAQIDGNALLTVYSESDGAGSIQNSGVSVGNASLQTGAKFAVTQTSTSTTASSTLYGTYNSVTDTGIVTATGDNTYGNYTTVTRTGSTTAGTYNSYGDYITVTADNAGAATSNAYGIYSTVTGADNNYAGIFMGGNVGIGTATPTSLLSVGATSQFQVSSTGAIAAAAGITSSGTITFSGLSTAGIVTNTSGGVLGTTVSVPIANGGTNATTIGSAGSVPYSTGTAYAFSAVGTSGQALISGAAGAPTWFAPTAGSILFAGTGGILEQDNANFFFDNTNNRLGIGTTTPSAMLDIFGTSNKLRLSYDVSNYTDLSVNSTGDLSVASSSATESQIVVGSNNAVDQSILFDSNSTDYFVGYDTTSNYFLIGSGSTIQTSASFLSINATTGNVGIGTAASAPLARLDLAYASTSTTGATEYGYRNTLSDTGIVTTGTDTTYGNYTTVTRTGATGGTINTYGDYINVTADNAGAGTSTAYGLYSNVSGADTNYAGIFMGGNVGIGDTTPDALLDIDSSATTTNNFGITNTGIFTGTGTSSIASIVANSATTGTLLNLSANGLTSGKGIALSSTSTAFTGNLQNITLSGSNAANTGNLLLIADTGALNTTTPFKVTAAGAATQVAALIENTGAGTSFRVNDESADTTPFIIDASGNVGIGIAAPAYKFEVNTDISTNYVAQFFNDGNNADRYGIQIQGGADDASGATYYVNALDGDGGQVGYIANTAGTFALTDVSDIRTKTNIVDTGMASATNVLNSLRVVDFNRLSNPDGPKITGFIAQEVEMVYPQAVTTGPTGLLGISKDSFIPVLVKAFQEEDARLTMAETAISTIDLKTDAAATTLGALQASIDTQLTVAGDAITALQVAGATADALQITLRADLDAVDARVAILENDANAEALKVSTIQTEVATLKEQIATLTDFSIAMDLSNVIVKDASGNVDLSTSKVTVGTLSADGLSITVTDIDAPTIGTAEILPVAVDADNDGNDDYTDLPMTDPEVIARDGKFVEVLTKAMIPMVNGSRIFTTFKGNPSGFNWVEKTKDANNDFVGFKIRLSDAITAPIKVDWLLIEQK